MSTKEVSVLTGLTLRQLQWLDKRGFHRKVKIEGGDKNYSEADLHSVLVIRRLRDSGLTLQEVKKILPRLRSFKAGFALIDPSLGVRFASTAEDVIRIGNRLTSAFRVIDLSEVPG